MTAPGEPRMAKGRQTAPRPRDRLAAFLADAYPGPGRDKRLATDLQITERSARNLFLGHWPSDAVLERIIARWGRAVWVAVFEPVVDEALADLNAKISARERELDELEAQRRATKAARFLALRMVS